MDKPAYAASAAVRVRVHLKPRKLTAESGNGLWQHGRAASGMLRNAHLFRQENEAAGVAALQEFQAGVILTGRVPRTRLDLLRRDPSVERVETLDGPKGIFVENGLPTRAFLGMAWLGLVHLYLIAGLIHTLRPGWKGPVPSLLAFSLAGLVCFAVFFRRKRLS